ncbi:50S ribosomal protein L13 [Radiomyces spectabilis]|uniref:50S ribosomal protein L13 n=1 Tax=Radiomyces spectabilis TaxID=64574 RepID=UPI002220E2BE|nr:50S ribosomal protein L13 [Radiomyces spectabilis]KAI8379626.1 50S ribosomal protein L13 [Radiomyces spectabilis]
MSQAIGNTALAYARVWHVVDARQRVLGRLATSVATTLMGKHKPIYDPASDCGDYVVVINAKDVLVTGRKAEQKLYRHHTGYPGGLKEINYETLKEKNPTEVCKPDSTKWYLDMPGTQLFVMLSLCGLQPIRKAVSGMLPKNRLRDVRLNRLMIFEGSEHPYEANIIKQHGLEQQQQQQQQ